VAFSDRHYLVYADGSCLGNPGPGGWGVVVRNPDGHVIERNGHKSHTTNNQMEIRAAIEGLRLTEPGAQVVLRSDSQYVVNTMTLRWKRKVNQDLWELLDLESAARTVSFEWVRGHDVDPINHRADELALMAAKGRLVADGAVAKKSRSGGMTYDEAQEALLAPLLRAGETMAQCEGCGANFVRSSEQEHFCSQASCQIKARR
jgi:ribonuclease HI